MHACMHTYMHIYIYTHTHIYTLQVYRSKAETSVNSELSEVFLKRNHRDEIARIREQAKQNVVLLSEKAAGTMAAFAVR